MIRYAIETARYWAARLHDEERGQDLLEYALIGGVVAAAILAVGALLSGEVTAMFQNIGDCITFDDTCKGLPIGGG